MYCLDAHVDADNEVRLIDLFVDSLNLSELIDHFNNRFSKRFIDKEKLKITKDAIELLTTYGFKGNVRELENMFIHFYTFCEKEITVKDLPDRVKSNNTTTLTLSDNERSHIIKVFNLNKGNILATAKTLDIHRDTLRRKLTEYGIREQNE